MEGDEKVNKRRVDRRVTDDLPQPGRRLIDLRALAAESPRESIARENEIVADLALRAGAGRPATVRVSEPSRGLVDPAVVSVV
jgi:hypothetical protein